MLGSFQVYSTVSLLHTHICIYSLMHRTEFFRFLSLIGYYKALNILPWAKQEALVDRACHYF